MKYLASLPFFGAGMFGIWHHKFVAGASWNWSHLLGLHHESLVALSILIGIIIWSLKYKH